jgi:hypothetical protein
VIRPHPIRADLEVHSLACAKLRCRENQSAFSEAEQSRRLLG